MRLNARLLNRFDNSTNWTSDNPTLASGEIGIQSDDLSFKIGDGATAWTDLDFAGGSAILDGYFLADGSVALSGHMLPDMTGATGTVSTIDIGSATKKIRNFYAHDAYIDAGSLYVNGKKVLEDVSGTITVSTDDDQDLKIKTTGTGDIVFQSESIINSVSKGGIQLNVPSDVPTKHINVTNLSANGNVTFSAEGSNAEVQFLAAKEITFTAPAMSTTGDADVTGTFTFGHLSHSALDDLSNDDHTQYVKADGTRAFTGAVVGVSPTEINQLATKSYVDSAVQGLDWQTSVLDRTTNASAVESLGNRYISTETSGGWTINNIYEWNGSSWDEEAVSEGMAAWVEDEDVLYTFNGSAWVKFGSTITHENLNAVNAGTYRHLSSSQVTDLTDGGVCTIHTHDFSGGLPSGATILVKSDTAITGFTLVTSDDDGVVYITKGSAAGGDSGGSLKSSSTWTQPNHVHSVPNHRHTGPSHTHTYTDVINHTHPTITKGSTGGSRGYLTATSNGTVLAGPNIANPNGGVSTGTTNADGTGYTGYAGTNDTGGGATSNSWRPKGYNYTQQEKI